MRFLYPLCVLSLIFPFFSSALTADEAGVSAEDVGFIQVEANPEEGFNFPYLLRVPDDADSALPVIFVEPNNTGSVSDDFAEQQAQTLKGAALWYRGNFYSQSLNAPYLVPIFPRPASQALTYTHALDRDTMEVSEGPLKRLDLQLIAMIENARSRLAARGLQADKKVVFIGFSASAKFSNRFTAIHPDRVKAVVAGGVGGTLILPLKELDGTELDFPIGIADLQALTGQPFDEEAWMKVPQYYYLGADDTNDSAQYDDAFPPEQRAVVFKVLGEQMQPKRWNRVQELLADSGADIHTATILGVGHSSSALTDFDSIRFIQAALAGNTVDFEPQAPQPDALQKPLPEWVRFVKADPAAGFNYPYYLALPEDGLTAARIFAECVNTGYNTDSIDAVRVTAIKQAESGSLSRITRQLGGAYLVPCFPRPASQPLVYTHMLDRDSLLIDSGALAHIDRQLIAMVDDARKRLADEGTAIDPRFIVGGFGSAANFANHMTVLHPDRIAGCLAMGTHGLLMQPLAELDGETLNVPLGIADIDAVTGAPFDRTAWQKVPQLILEMDEGEGSDPAAYSDSYSDDEREVIYKVLGRQAYPERWEKAKSLYQAAGANAEFLMVDDLKMKPIKDFLQPLFASESPSAAQ